MKNDKILIGFLNLAEKIFNIKKELSKG